MGVNDCASVCACTQRPSCACTRIRPRDSRSEARGKVWQRGCHPPESRHTVSATDASSRGSAYYVVAAKRVQRSLRSVAIDVFVARPVNSYSSVASLAWSRWNRRRRHARHRGSVVGAACAAVALLRLCRRDFQSRHFRRFAERGGRPAHSIPDAKSAARSSPARHSARPDAGAVGAY